MGTFLKYVGILGWIMGLGMGQLLGGEEGSLSDNASPPATENTGSPALKVATFSCDITPPVGQPIYPSYKPLEVIEEALLAKGNGAPSRGKALCPLCAGLLCGGQCVL